MIEQSVKQFGLDLGFSQVGIAPADAPFLAEAGKIYDQWIENGFHADMEYLRRHSSIKKNPSHLLPDVKSVICVSHRYPRLKHPPSGHAKISAYTNDLDYHDTLQAKLNTFAQWLNREWGCQSFIFADKHPVLERFWAHMAGLGWIGKNSMLMNRKEGSFFFIGGLLTTLELAGDRPETDHCGKCTRCIDACPTHAILPNAQLNATKCIAYHTIENKTLIPEDIQKKSDTWIAGCDICQDVCPWNSKLPQVGAKIETSLDVLNSWTESEFNNYIKDRAMFRMKFSGFRRNLKSALLNFARGL